MLRRASSLGFETWWRRAQSVGFCAHPVQLAGADHYGRERLVWVRCNNRRAAVCPSCADLYARDTWQLVHAGAAGGHHNVPSEVADRPQVFATLTAPGFGTVHASTGASCRDERRVGRQRCVHGKSLWCSMTHDHRDVSVGQPLCPDCYDYGGHVLFTWHLPELWRRFTIALRRALATHLRTAGVDPKSVRVSFVKVVEMQARAIPHIHALIRLDPADDTTAPGDHKNHGPAATSGGGEPRRTPQPTWESPVTAAALAVLIQQTARSVSVDLPDPGAEHADDAEPVTVRFGTQIDTQPLKNTEQAPKSPVAENNSSDLFTEAGLAPRRVAGYLAKYVTKSLHEFGIAARRLSAEAIADLDITDHLRAILTTIADLAHRARSGGIASLSGIGRWLHTLGYRGHITTKSRHYSTTMGALRAIRATWSRQQAAKDAVRQHYSSPDRVEPIDEVWWEFDRAGHATPGDRTLVYSAALQRIHARRIGLAEARRQGRDEQWGPPGAR